MQDLLVSRDISKTYHDGETDTQVLNNVSLHVGKAEHVAILGSSGSGKSTLLHILGGLDTPDTGEVIFQNQSLFTLPSSSLASLRNQHIGFIYQFHHLLAEFDALENVAMPLMIGQCKPGEAKARAKELLERVGLSHRFHHRPSALSGGERQRVAIARALVTNPALVLADEPTGNLDDKTGKQVYALLRSLSRDMNTSFVVVTHDRALARQMDRVLTLTNGVLHAGEEGTVA